MYVHPPSGTTDLVMANNICLVASHKGSPVIIYIELSMQNIYYMYIAIYVGATDYEIV